MSPQCKAYVSLRSFYIGGFLWLTSQSFWVNGLVDGTGGVCSSWGFVYKKMEWKGDSEFLFLLVLVWFVSESE